MLNLIPIDLKLGLFLFSNGSEIVEFAADQIEESTKFAIERYEEGKAFIEKLIAEYESGGTSILSAEIDKEIADRLPDALDRATEIIAHLGGTPEEFFASIRDAIAEDADAVRASLELYNPSNVAATGIPGDHTAGLEVEATETPWHMQPDGLWDKIWAIATGEGELVSVIDTGGAPGHEDLKEPKFTLSRVPGEPTGVAGHMHGPHCVGTAVGQNRLGIAPGADYGTVQCLTSRGSGQSNWTAQAIHDSLDNGATVISISIGGGGPDASTAAALIRAQEMGVIVVAAAGNAGYQGRPSTDWPANDVNAAMIAAFQRSGLISGFSSGGPNVDMAFPGSDIISVNFRGGRMLSSGTSMATPGAAGFAALIQSFLVKYGFARLNGTREFIAFCNEHATDAGSPGEDSRFGAGILKALEVLQDNKPDDVGALAAKPSPLGRLATMVLVSLSLFFGSHAMAQELSVETVVETVEITETFFGGKLVSSNRNEPRVISQVKTASPAKAIEVDASQATVIGTDLKAETYEVKGGLLLLTEPGKYIVLPGAVDATTVVIEAPEPEFNVALFAASLADNLGDPPTRLALADNYSTQVDSIAGMTIEAAQAKVKQSTIDNVFAKRSRESQRYDWVNGFQRPLEAELDRLGLAEWDIETYREALRQVSKGLKTITPVPAAVEYSNAKCFGEVWAR